MVGAASKTVEVSARGLTAVGDTVEVSARGLSSVGGTVEVSSRGFAAVGGTVEVSSRGLRPAAGAKVERFGGSQRMRTINGGVRREVSILFLVFVRLLLFLDLFCDHIPYEPNDYADDQNDDAISNGMTHSLSLLLL